MGIVSDIKAQMRPVYTPPVWTPERLQGLVALEEFVTFREARASLITWVILPALAAAGTCNGSVWLPALLLLSVLWWEPHITAVHSRFRTLEAGWRNNLSLPWRWWWSRPIMAVVLFGIWLPIIEGGDGTLRFDPHITTGSIALVWAVLALWMRWRLLRGQKIQAILQMYGALGVSRSAPTAH